MDTRPAMHGLTRHATTLKGVTLHHWSGGNPQGVPVLLWHGFVETAYAWRRVAPLLIDAGCCVLIPDMRGYGDSDKPEGTDGYDVRSLANEFRALVAATSFGGGRPIVLAAHDMGAPPALIWAADHPKEVAALVYIDEPVLLGNIIRSLVSYTPQSAVFGSLWWWLLPYAKGAAEKIIVGNERGWLEWFYEFGQSKPAPETINEYLRTFSGREGVLGALGIYRAGFKSIEQTEPLAANKVTVPITAVGGVKSLGAHVAEMVSLVASNVTPVVIEDCGHFSPEDQPEKLARVIIEAAERSRKV
jgi:pimeloyl-ACP methyl ester carboxylesterase